MKTNIISSQTQVKTQKHYTVTTAIIHCLRKLTANNMLIALNRTGRTSFSTPYSLEEINRQTVGCVNRPV